MRHIIAQLEDLAGLNIFPIFTLVLFFSVFVAMLVWLFLIDKARILQYKQAPLDDDSPFHV